MLSSKTPQVTKSTTTEKFTVALEADYFVPWSGSPPSDGSFPQGFFYVSVNHLALKHKHLRKSSSVLHRESRTKQSPHGHCGILDRFQEQFTFYS